MRKFAKITLALTVASAICGCHEIYDPATAGQESQQQDNQQQDNSAQSDYTIWRFVHDCSQYYYYWNSNVPRRVTYSDYDSPDSLFESWRYSKDHFSGVFSNYSDLLKKLDAEYKTDGLETALYLYHDNTVIGLVEYVYPNSPAYKAGIKRGHVIMKVDGQTLTTDNYQDLLDAESCKYECGKMELQADNTMDVNDSQPETFTVQKTDMDINPVQITKTFSQNGKKIGYLLYGAFTSSTTEIMDAISQLQNENISDLILDLRFNGGGYVNTLDTLASMLVPSSLTGKTFLTVDYNSYLNREYRNYYGRNFNKELFVDISPKLESLQTLYVLTSYSTGSASEELISGLQPYMNVVLIGDDTYGKFTQNMLINDQNDSGSDPDGIPYSEWGVYLSVGICKNSLGEMNFENGFEPDYYITDTYTEPLGSQNEALTAKALELAAGGSLAKSTRQYPKFDAKRIGSHGKPDICNGAMIRTAFPMTNN